MLDDPLGFIKRLAVGFLIVIVVLVLVGAGNLATSLIDFVVDGFQNFIQWAGTLG